MKRLLDIIASIVGIIVLAPVFALIAVGIKLDSVGPVFFRQKRMGRSDRNFQIFKFRTMVSGAEKTGSAITGAGDSRVTRLGKFLRDYKIDELPQLLNVLVGEMSLVGPRPELPKYKEYYTGCYADILKVRPGITDPASLQFRNESDLMDSDADPEILYLDKILPEKLRINLRYLANASFWTDLVVIWLTIVTAIRPGMMTRFESLHGGKHQMSLQNWIVQSGRHRLRGRRRLLLKISTDAAMVVLAYFLAYFIRFEGDIPADELKGFVPCVAILLSLTLGSFYQFKLYKGLYEYSSLKDLVSLLGAHTVGWTAFVVMQIFLEFGATPRSVLVIYWLLGLMYMGGVRLSYRMLKEIIQPRNGSVRTLILGAGAAGEMIIRQMQRDSQLGFRPVLLVDDDLDKANASIHGVTVRGTSEDIPRLVQEHNISQLIIATPSATARDMRRFVTICEKAKVSFKTVPGPQEIMNGKVNLEQLRGVKIEDLLEREPVEKDNARMSTFLKGQVVLVTGAAGSIGQELCWQIMEQRPAKLVMFDHSENGLFYLDNDFKNKWSKGYTTVVGDVCNAAKVNQVFYEHRPSIVFHAAAHKHVPLMELNPEEAVKNNLKGTMQVSNAAARHGVGRFVLISTDKAVEPTSIMGASKRLAELYLQGLNKPEGTRFATVRFGNVLGSNGSVVTLFQKQISNGGPVTVTDPDMTRYFMTIAEAVTLIVQASAICKGGEVFVLDMGEPVKVVDMARHLISLSGFEPGRDIGIKFTGKRPGEKMYEQLWLESEAPSHTEYEKIFVARSNGHDYEVIMQKLSHIVNLAEKMERFAMYDKIQELIPTYQPYTNGEVVKVEL